MAQPVQYRDANGNLVQRDQTLGELSAQQPVQSPAGAAAVGANSDQSKMAGTPNQQLAEAKQAPRVAEAGQAGFAQPQQSAAQRQDTSAGSRLQALGDIGTRLDALVKARLSAPQPATPAGKLPGTVVQSGDAQTVVPTGPKAGAVNNDAVTALGLSGDQTTTATGFLNSYMTATTDAQRNEVEAKFSQYLQSAGKPPVPITSLLSTDVAQVTAADTAARVKDAGNITAGSLAISPKDATAMAALFPGQNWRDKTVADIKAAILTEQQTHQSKVADLQGQLAAAPPGSAAAAAIQQALDTLGVTGVQSEETDFAALNTKVQQADLITMKDGTQKSVADLFKDKNISQDIADYLQGNVTGEVGKLQEMSPDLFKWVDQHAKQLKALVATYSGNEQKYTTQQSSYGDLSKVTADTTLNDASMAALVPGWNKSAAHTADDIAAARSTLDKSGLVQALRSPDSAALGIGKLVSGLSADQVKELGGLSREQVLQAFTSGQQLADPQLLKMAGLTAPPPYTTDVKLQAQLKAWAPVMTAAEQADATTAQDPMFQDLVKRGVVTSDNLAASIPQYKQAAAEYATEKTQLSAIAGFTAKSNVDDVVNALFGLPSAKSLDDNYQALKQAMKADPNDGTLFRKYDQFRKQFDPNDDGHIDQADVGGLLDQVAGRFGTDAKGAAAGKGKLPDVGDLMKSGAKTSFGQQSFADLSQSTQFGAGSLQDQIATALQSHSKSGWAASQGDTGDESATVKSGALNPDKLTLDDLKTLTPDNLDKLYKTWPQWKLKDLPTEAQVKASAKADADSTQKVKDSQLATDKQTSTDTVNKQVETDNMAATAKKFGLGNADDMYRYLKSANVGNPYNTVDLRPFYKMYNSFMAALPDKSKSYTANVDWDALKSVKAGADEQLKFMAGRGLMGANPSWAEEIA